MSWGQKVRQQSHIKLSGLQFELQVLFFFLFWKDYWFKNIHYYNILLKLLEEPDSQNECYIFEDL